MYNTNRMLHEYTQRFYLPAAARFGALTKDGAAGARALAAWKHRARAAWPHVAIETVDGPTSEVAVGMELPVQARVRLGELSPDDVAVQLFDGPVNTEGSIVGGQAVEMTVVERAPDGRYTYVGAVPCRGSGLHGYSVRVMARNADLSNPFEAGLITWANGSQ
jgi:starch phosphorylase